jgi:D-glycero-D-manno-heptose 1,7-bisphosphate phosphatase
MKKAVILDRDGVLTKIVKRGPGWETPPWSLEELEFTPYAKRAVRKLAKLGFEVHVATNQPDIEECDDQTLAAIHRKLYEHVGKSNLTGIVACRARGTYCYKPSPGMAELLINARRLDKKQTFMVGDSWKDVVCGHLAGLRTVLIATGSYKWPREAASVVPTVVVKNLLEAVIYIEDATAIHDEGVTDV